MSKRRLTRQQTARIAKRRAKAGPALGDATASASALGPEQPGLILSRYGARVDVEHPQTRTVVRCKLRANLGEIVTGDRVTWRAEGNAGVVVSVAPRETTLHRPDSYGKLKLVAANITRCVITIAPEPEAHANLIDRYLVVAETLEFEPLLLLNKADLLGPNNTALRQLCARYQQLGYTTAETSVHDAAKLAKLQLLLATGTSVFVGQSGVGKSSVIQALLPNEQIKVGELSLQANKGRHTTTHARLYHFPSGGDCIDSPGIREFGLWHLTAEQVALGFRELRPFVGHCRFRNCSHEHEPNCAIQQALTSGDISLERFNSYQHIIRSLSSVVMQT